MGNQSSVGLHRENDHSTPNSKPKCSTTTLLLPFSSPVWLFVLVRTKPNKFWFTALVEIGAYVSYCGTSWQEVQTGGKHLVLNEKLCCVRNRKSGQVKYRPCNGSKRASKSC